MQEQTCTLKKGLKLDSCYEKAISRVYTDQYIRNEIKTLLFVLGINLVS